MRHNKTVLIIAAAIIIVATIVLWSWHKDNWWLLLGIPFSFIFFSNKQTVGHSLGFVITFVIGHIIYTAIPVNFQFTVWSWFFFLCGLMSYAMASIIFGTEQSNWERQAKINGYNRTFEEYEKDKYLNSPEIKELIQNIGDKYKNSSKD